MTNKQYRELISAQPAEVRRLERANPGIFEAGVLDAIDGKPLRIDPSDTAAEAATYSAGYHAALAQHLPSDHDAD
jgi:hypothetical protein